MFNTKSSSAMGALVILSVIMAQLTDSVLYQVVCSLSTIAFICSFWIIRAIENLKEKK